MDVHNVQLAVENLNTVPPPWILNYMTTQDYEQNVNQIGEMYRTVIALMDKWKSVRLVFMFAMLGVLILSFSVRGFFTLLLLVLLLSFFSIRNSIRSRYRRSLQTIDLHLAELNMRYGNFGITWKLTPALVPYDRQYSHRTTSVYYSRDTSYYYSRMIGYDLTVSNGAAAGVVSIPLAAANGLAFATPVVQGGMARYTQNHHHVQPGVAAGTYAVMQGGASGSAGGAGTGGANGTGASGGTAGGAATTVFCGRCGTAGHSTASFCATCGNEMRAAPNDVCSGGKSL